MELYNLDHLELLRSLKLGDVRTLLYTSRKARVLEMFLPLAYDSVIRKKINPFPIISSSGTITSIDGDQYSGGIRIEGINNLGHIQTDRKIENYRLLASLDLRPYIGRTREEDCEILILKGFEKKIKNLTGLPENLARGHLLEFARKVIMSDQGIS